VAVINNRFVVAAVPAVELDAATSHEEGANVRLRCGLARELIPREVRVVRGIDVVV